MSSPFSFLVATAHVVLVSGVIQQPLESHAKLTLRRNDFSLSAAHINATLSDFAAVVKQGPAVPIVEKPRLLPIPVSDGLPTVENSSTAPSAVHPIDWRLMKIVFGILLVSPALPAMIRWDMSGRPPHPFLMSENAVTSWPTWMFDLVQHMAIVGMDLILLGGVEYDWHTTMLWFGVWLLIRAIVGFAAFTYSVMSKHGPYGKQSQVDLDTLEITNKFQDIGTSLVHLSVLLMAQIIFFFFFMGEMMNGVQLTRKAYVFWAAAIPMQIISRGLMGRSFCNEVFFWNRLFNADAGTQLQRDFDGQVATITVNPLRIFVRALMSFYVNNVCMSLVALTLPLFMMSAASEIDFVKDCFAVVFITTLDDVSEVMPLKLKMLPERAARV